MELDESEYDNDKEDTGDTRELLFHDIMDRELVGGYCICGSLPGVNYLEKNKAVVWPRNIF